MLAVLAVASGAYYVSHHPRPPRAVPRQSLPAAPTALRRSVAVVGFKNLSGRAEIAWLSTALSEMLTTELAAGERLRTIPGENVARMKSDLSLGETESFGKETLARIRTNLGTDVIVLGSYLDLAGQIRLDLRIQDAWAGETMVTLAEEGSESELFDLVERAGARLRTKLGVGAVSPVDAKSVRASLPAKPEAARLYADGLARLRRFDTVAARTLFQRAAGADPSFAMARSALAEAWSNLGYDGKAAEEARRAFDLSSGLPREERLWVKGRFRETVKDWPRAIEIYHALFGFFPDNLDYGLRLAAAQVSATKGNEALATVQALRSLPPPASDSPRIDLVEAAAAGSLSDFRRERASAAQAAEKGTRIGARLLVASARAYEGWALLNLGEFDAARRAFGEARGLYHAAGDRGGAAWTLINIGVTSWQRGDLAAATTAYDVALRTFQEIGQKKGVARALNYLAISLVDQKDLNSAERTFERSLSAFREVGDQGEVAWCLNNIAEVLRRRGNLALSRRRYDEALGIFREVGERRGLAAVLMNIGGVLLDQGALAEAKAMYAEALTVEKAIGNKSHAAWALAGLGRLLLAEGDLPGARANLDQALAIRTELGEKATLADTRLALGELALEEVRTTEAEALVRQAAETYAAQHAREDEAAAHAVLARALLAQGRVSEARRAADRAVAFSARGENRAVRISVAIAAARVAGASGRPSAALRALEGPLAEASRAGLLGLELEVRLAMGEIAIASESATGTRAQLQALEREARAKGFGLIARKTAALSRR